MKFFAKDIFPTRRLPSSCENVLVFGRCGAFGGCGGILCLPDAGANSVRLDDDVQHGQSQAKQQQQRQQQRAGPDATMTQVHIRTPCPLHWPVQGGRATLGRGQCLST